MKSAFAASALAAFLVVEAAAGPQPTFSLDVPDFMVVGPVKLAARTTDPRVASVDWKIQGRSKVTPPPFELTFNVGRMPLPKTVVATALDADGLPLYRQQAILDPGERFVSVDILAPLQGQEISGPVPVLVRPRIPPGEAVETLTLEDGSGPKPLPDSREIRRLEIDVPPRTMALTAFLRTSEGRTAEQTILLNGMGFSTSDSAHIVEQLVSVDRDEEPVEGLTAAEFEVKDEGGRCEVREVRLLKETPLAMGLAIDTSVSLLHTEALKRVTAGLFLSKALKERDLAYLISFGPAVRRNVAWTRSHEAIRRALLALTDATEAGTRLHEVLLHALYQFQGAQGGRALILVTDGNAFEDPVTEEAALEYVRLSAVPIYTLGLPWATMTKKELREFDDKGKKVTRIVRVPRCTPRTAPSSRSWRRSRAGASSR